MKLIIDIPEEDYTNIEPFLNGETIKGGFNLFKTLEIIKNGTPLKPLGEEMRIAQKAITDEKVLVGFNMALALCNKHIGGIEE